MKRKISFFILFILVNLAAIAQQEPLFSNYMLTKPIINPGFVGADNTINAVFINRSMFAGFGDNVKGESGRPVTSVFGVDAPVEIFGKKSGLGIVIMSDALGFSNNVNVDFDFAYHHAMDNGTLGFGLTFGLNSYSITPTWSNGEGEEHYTDIGSDDALPDNFKKTSFGLGAGMYYETTKYYVGFSASKLNSPEIVFFDGTQENVVAFYAPHFYLTSGYNIELPNPLFDLRPSLVLRSDLSAYSLDLNGTMYYKSKYWAGFGLRASTKNIASVTFLGGTELMNGITLGYAMDINTSYMLVGGAATSHEVIVTYSFNLDTKRNQKYKSVRYL